jgi:hypothetical protein
MAQAQTRQQYDSLTDAMEAFGDYTPEDNTFKVLSEKPLSVRISPQVTADDLPEVVDALLKRALVYAVLNAFIYTDVNRIQVKAQPLQISFIDPRTQTLVNTPSFTVDITRDKALAVVQRIFRVKAFSDLVTSNDGFDTWSSAFEAVYYDDAKGLNDLVKALGAK